jgi:nicotinamidase/pyrazinamidase
VVGIATDYCVRATALDSVRHGFGTTVLTGFTAGVAPGSTAAALTELRAAGVRVV